jgi:hypothetical protein
MRSGRCHKPARNNLRTAIGSKPPSKTARNLVRAHTFDLARAQHGIDYRPTKFNHPWTNGQVERMNRTIKDATVRRL